MPDAQLRAIEDPEPVIQEADGEVVTFHGVKQWLVVTPGDLEDLSPKGGRALAKPVSFEFGVAELAPVPGMAPLSHAKRARIRVANLKGEDMNIRMVVEGSYR